MAWEGRPNALLIGEASSQAAPTNALMQKTPQELEASMPNQYQTKLTPQQQPAYQAYIAKLARLQGRPTAGVMRDDYDYDLQGAFLSNLQPDARGHLSDQFKKPNHPTFSTGSQYHGVDGNEGGVWSQPQGPQGPWTFTAGQTNVDSMGGQAGLQRYFDERERGNTVIMPPPRPTPYPGY